jgi:hypothetical protein
VVWRRPSGTVPRRPRPRTSRPAKRQGAPPFRDFRELTTAAADDITWLVRDRSAAVHGAGLVDAVGAAPLPSGTPYAWIAGESGIVRSLRRHAVDERGIDRRAVTFVGYWRLGAGEDRLRAEAGTDEDPAAAATPTAGPGPGLGRR